MEAFFRQRQLKLQVPESPPINSGAYPSLAKSQCSKKKLHKPAQQVHISLQETPTETIVAPLAMVQPSRLWTAETTRPQDIRFPSDLPLLHALKLSAPQDTNQLARRTASHLASWRKITSNPWVLQVVSGYRLDFRAQTYQSYRPVTVEQDWQLTPIDKEVQTLLEKGAIEEVCQRNDEFYSSLFLIPKKSGQMQPVINLRPLNQFLRYQHFKMEGIHVVKDLLRQGDWLTRIDLKDAYFSIPIHTQDRKYLRFLWQKRAF